MTRQSFNFSLSIYVLIPNLLPRLRNPRCWNQLMKGLHLMRLCSTLKRWPGLTQIWKQFLQFSLRTYLRSQYLLSWMLWLHSILSLLQASQMISRRWYKSFTTCSAVIAADSSKRTRYASYVVKCFVWIWKTIAVLTWWAWKSLRLCMPFLVCN